MTQQPDGIRREADLHGVTTNLPPAAEVPPPDEFTQAGHFVVLTISLYLLYALCSSMSFTVLRNSGFYDWYYGPRFVADALGPKSPEQQVGADALAAMGDCGRSPMLAGPLHCYSGGSPPRIVVTSACHLAAFRDRTIKSWRKRSW